MQNAGKVALQVYRQVSVARREARTKFVALRRSLNFQLRIQLVYVSFYHFRTGSLVDEGINHTAHFAPLDKAVDADADCSGKKVYIVAAAKVLIQMFGVNRKTGRFHRIRCCYRDGKAFVCSAKNRGSFHFLHTGFHPLHYIFRRLCITKAEVAINFFSS